MDKQKLKKYFYSNLASLFWSSFLLVGGGIFVAYYAHIGYMPDFDLKSSVTLLSAASITAILTVMFFLIVLILPGMFWANTWADNSSLKTNWENATGDKNLLKTTLWFGGPVLFFYGFFTILYFSLVVTIPYLIIGIFGFSFFVHKKFGLSGKQLAKEIWGYTYSSFACAILAFFPIYLVLTLAVSATSTTKGSPEFVGILIAIFIAFINVLATAKPKALNGAIYYLGLGLATFFVVFASFEIFHRIPERVMEVYKFGAINAKSIVLKPEGCETLQLYGLLTDVKENKQCLLSEVKILSRLGSDMYIMKNDLKFTIRNSEVLSWSVNEASNKKNPADR
ncbi:MAG: hypothetical protein NTW42_00350 [Deltaproteobacteria bacterium]|nr:hypothetical protein [Deltaproteobacteria bacterium]